MGRDSRGRAQEAQWKLMLQGTKVRCSVQTCMHHGAGIACLLHAEDGVHCWYPPFAQHACSMLIGCQLAWSPSSAMCPLRP
jgi:hypothetical protein